MTDPKPPNESEEQRDAKWPERTRSQKNDQNQEEKRFLERQRQVLEMRRERAEWELKLLQDYHKTSIYQARVGFFIGLFLGATAFAIILWMVVTIITSEQVDQAALVKSLSAAVTGILTGAYSVFLVRQADAVQKLMRDFLDKLRADRTAEDYLELARIVDDEEVRGRIKALLALTSRNTDSLAKLLEDPTFLERMLGVKDASSRTSDSKKG